MWDLTLIQKYIGYRANKVFYNLENYDFLISQHNYLTAGNGNFEFLFGKQRLIRIKEIKKEIKLKNKIKFYLSNLANNSKVLKIFFWSKN